MGPKPFISIDRQVTHHPCDRICSTYRSQEVRHEDHNQEDVSHNPHESQQGNHVGGNPHGQEFHEGIPLHNPTVSDTSSALYIRPIGHSYVVLQNVVRDRRLVHAGIFIGLEGKERIVGEGLLSLCRTDN